MAKKKSTQQPQEVDVFGAAGLSQEELLKQALENIHKSKESKKNKSSKEEKETTNEQRNTMARQETEHQVKEEKRKKQASKQQQKRLDKEEEEEETIQDPETRQEYEKFLSEVGAFTLSGRQKQRVKVSYNRISKNDVDGFRHSQGVSWIRLQDITLYFGSVKLLTRVNWEVKSGDRVGLVGDNGSGKTTMLKILAGLITPDSGEIIKSSPRVRTAFLKQEFVDELCPTRTLKEELLSVFEEENKMLQEYRQLEDKIANMGTEGNNLEYVEELLNQLESYRTQCEDSDVWNLENRIERLLPQLGFLPEDTWKPVSSFSGGWKVRIGLGKVLLKKPDVLLLDEPTNHLDIESLEWLEEYLSSCNIALVLVSHDREFLDRVANRIVEVENGETHEFVGNYTSYLRQKEDMRTAWEAAYQRQQKFLEEQYSFIRRFQSSATRASQVKSREKLLQNMQLKGELVPRPPRPGKPLVLRFPSAPRSGNDVVEFRNVTHGYGDRVLFRNVNLLVERGDRLAIVGPNGSGKSTLLRLITGQEKPNQGEIMVTSHNLVTGYFEQSQADVLPLDKTVYETIEQAAGTSKSYEEIRALLGRFLFKGDSVYKSVASLSGGEKARLALCKILVSPVNLLVLDEPSNHIDIGAKETLEEALQLYDGTLILVSHDRYFVSRVAKQILSIENEQVVFYNGDYRYYLDHNEDFKERLERRFIQGVTEIKSAPEMVTTDEVLGNVEKRKKAFGGSNIAAGKKKLYDTKRWK
ncbi:ABC transporter F family member 5 [Galdieria sulphuraria]|nr:ABC transporter F family member 5 [Galdieria sulphuraria]